MKRFKSYGVLWILAAGSLWGMAGFFVRNLQARGIAGMQTVFVRALFTTLAIGLYLAAVDRKLLRIRLRDLWLFAADGIFSVAVFPYCYYQTIERSTLSVAAVLLYTAPFFVVLISAVLFHERLTPKKCLLCFTAFIGCCFVSGVFSGLHSISGACIAYGLLSGFSYSLYTVFSNMMLKRGYHVLTATLYTYAFATLGALPFINVPKTLSASFASLPAAVFVLGAALVYTIMPSLLYTAGLKTVESSRALIIATVEPVVATLLGLVMYGEMLTWQGVVGIVLVIGSVIILNMKTGKFR